MGFVDRLDLEATSTKLNFASYSKAGMVAKGKRTTGGLQSVSHSMSIPLKDEGYTCTVLSRVHYECLKLH